MSRHPGFLCILKLLWIEQHSSDRTTSLIGKREIQNGFSSLRRWLKRWNNSKVILSHTTNQLYYKQLLFYFTLDRIIKVHNKSGYGFMQKLFLAGMNKETTSVHVNYNHRSRHY